MNFYQKLEYQELESQKYLSDRVENEYRREIVRRKLVEEFWTLAAFYSVICAVGFLVFQFNGVSITDLCQAAVNAFVDWSIAG